jgi:hypothetical protein
VVIFEQFGYAPDINWGKLAYEVTGANATAKVILALAQVGPDPEDARAEFNRRLRAMDQKAANWKPEGNYLHRLFGKELVVLAWASKTPTPA